MHSHPRKRSAIVMYDSVAVALLIVSIVLVILSHVDNSGE